MTLFTVGVSRIDCSEIREKPSSSPPHPAKRKSIPTKTIINLVGILAVLVRCSAAQRKGFKGKTVEAKSEYRAQAEAVRRALVNCVD